LESPETAKATALTAPGAALADPRQELAALARAIRAHAEEVEASGAWGAPAAPPLAASSRAAGSERAPSHESPEQGRAAARGPGAARVPSPAEASARSGASEPAGTPAERATAAVAREHAAFSPAPSAANSDAVRARLLVLAEETRACTRCGLHQGRSQTVFARGTGTSGLVFVGEGPGEEEDRQGFPFVGPAGQLLDRMIAAMELGRDDVYVCNIVKCRPPKNRKPEPDEMSACMPFLAEQLSLIEPKVIVALGATAVQGLLGTSEGITRMRGQWKSYRGQIPVMPTFHPAYLLRTPAAKRDVWKDLQEVLRRMRGADPAP